MPEVALVIFLAKLIDPIAALPALAQGISAGLAGKSSCPQRRLE
jgi:hypothetical protein